MNISIENVKVSCKVAKPDFDARRFHMSEIFRENSAGATDLPPAFFFRDIFFKCDLGLAPAEGSAFFFRDFFYLRKRVQPSYGLGPPGIIPQTFVLIFAQGTSTRGRPQWIEMVRTSNRKHNQILCIGHNHARRLPWWTGRQVFDYHVDMGIGLLN